MADTPDIFGKQFMLTAGPTPLPPLVSQVMAEPVLYHRAPAFVRIYARVLERLPEVFQTQNDVLCFAATGTAAMESAVANLVRPGEPAVDAVSCLGAVALPQDEWGVDVVVAGSQKSLMCPPGLAFASVSERAMALAAETPGGRYYLDWRRTADGQREDPPNSAFTPAVTLFRALDVALDLILAEGLERAFARHALLARAARAGIEALGLERFGPDDENANVVTVARLPEEIDGAKVPKLMRDRYGVTIAGAQGHLKGRIARIAHCGYYGAFDIVIALTALEMALRDLGHDAEPGAGGGAAQRGVSEAGPTPTPAPRR